MAKVKICGIKRESDIEYLNSYRPDYAGFIFAPSKRRVTREYAKFLAQKLDKGIKRVGIFVDELPEEVTRTVRECGLDIIQLHGDETQDYIYGLKKELGVGTGIWKAISVKDGDSIREIGNYDVDAFVLDAFSENCPGGSGKVFDWRLAVNAKKYGNIMLAGGLDPVNVKEAISLVRPFAVDVSSGVETGGCKDEDKVKRFIYGARYNTY